MSGSLTTAETIIRRVQRDFGDSAETQITIDDIFDWINFGQLEIVRQTECLEGSKTWTFKTGDTPSFLVPDNFLREQKFVYKTNSIIPRIQFQDTWSGNPAQGISPSAYYIRAGQLYLVPTYTPADGDVFDFYYVVKPTEVHNMNDTIDIGSNFTLDLIEYCMMKAKELTEDYQHANIIGGRLQNRLANSKDEANVPSDSYAVVRSDPNDNW